MGYLQIQWQRGRKIYGKRSWRETRRTFYIQCAPYEINEK